MKGDKGIVISGLSGRFPNSNNVDQFWDNLVAGTSVFLSVHLSVHLFVNLSVNMSVCQPLLFAIGLYKFACLSVWQENLFVSYDLWESVPLLSQQWNCKI